MFKLSLLGLCVACSPVTAKVFHGPDTVDETQSVADLVPDPTDDHDLNDDESQEDTGVADQAEPPPPEDAPSDVENTDTGPPPTIDPELPEWTFMVYLAADNNLEASALTDLNEMEVAGSTDQVNILVELDRAHGYSSADGDWTGARRYRVEADSNRNHITSPVAVDLGEVDSGAPGTFIDFIRWGVETYPAKRYAFVIWNHGWGWSITSGLKGVASDDHSGSELTVAGGEYEAILQAATEITGAPIALLGMDACLMASWEVARVSADFGSVFVASQATEALDGWAFDTALSDLIAEPEMSAGQLGTVIARRFHETEDATLSVLNLEALADMDEALDTFATTVMADDNPRAQVSPFSRHSQGFDGEPADRDLGDFMMRVAEGSDNPDVVYAAENVSLALEDVIISNFTYGEWVADATGLSIYLPRFGPDSSYLIGSWNSLTQWDEMLEAIY
jgi:hypothetical protein